jgi:ABC-type thiamine transport system substrate-binding protein
LAAKVFEIIGAAAIILSVLIAVAVLYFLNKILKKVNKVLGERKGDVSKDLQMGLDGLKGAQGQIETVSAMTKVAKAGMRSTVSAADKLVAFVKTEAFQTGVPVVMWVMLVFVALPRALFPRKKKKKKVTPIPPPSWEAAAE